MHFSQFITTLVVLPAMVLALPAPLDTSSIEAREPTTVTQRQSCVVTCGSTCYYQSDLDNALNTGYSDYQSGNDPDNYPHTYNNYEGFDFSTPGPYQEFPILSSYQEYDGGSPGPDRVIFNTQGTYAGTITHTGASGNDFVACDGGVN